MALAGRRGFSFLEMLVIIAIIAVMIALLLPAIQRVREAAARSQCQGHLCQIAVATHQYHAAQRHFPPSRLYDQYASWAVLLLPYLGEESLYRQWDLHERYQDQCEAARQGIVKIYFCPSRRSPPSLTRLAALDQGFPGHAGDYAGNAGTSIITSFNIDGWRDVEDADRNAQVNGTIISATDWIFEGQPGESRLLDWRGTVKRSAIASGGSQTILFGEKHVPTGTENSDVHDTAILNGNHAMTITRVAGRGWDSDSLRVSWAFNLAQSKTDRGGGPPRYERIFGSAHPGICNFLMADGSVRQLRTSLDPIMLEALASRFVPNFRDSE